MSEAPKQLTVGELKRLLAELPDDMLVYTEGCDCVGPSDGIRVEPNWPNKRIEDLIIARNDRIDR